MRHSICYLLILLTIQSLRTTAQDPVPGTMRFVEKPVLWHDPAEPLEFTGSTYQRKTTMQMEINAEGECFTDGAIIRWAQLQRALKPASFELHLFSLQDGSPMATKELEWNKHRKTAAVVTWKDDIHVFTYELEKRELTLQHWVLSSSDLSEISPMRVISTSSVQGDIYPFRLHTFISPDQSKLLLYQGSKFFKDEQSLNYWVLDQNGDHWHGSHTIPYKKFITLTQGVVIGDNGTIHLALETPYSETKKPERGTYSEFTILGINSTEVKTREFTPPSGLMVLGVDLIHANDQIHALGFLGSPSGRNTMTTNGYKVSYAKDAQASGAWELLPLPEPIPASIHSVSAAAADNGVIYFTGTDFTFTGTSTTNEHLITCAVDRKGELLYATHIPRKQNTTFIAVKDHYTLAGPGNAMVLFGDSEVNLERYRSGGSLEQQKEQTSPTVLMSIADDGTAEYAIPGMPVAYSIYSVGFYSHPTGGGFKNNVVLPDERTVILKAKKEVGKKKFRDGWLVWNMEQ